jgi:methylmalonyl-CoA epimerase
MTRLEHIGIAVDDAAPVRALLLELLGLEEYKVETVESERVDTHFIGAGGVKLELLETLEPDSAIGRFLERRGAGIHHLAFEVDRLDDILERATRLGLKPINAEPKDGADGKRVFFLHPKETYGILIEVCAFERFPGSRIQVPMPHGEVTAFETGSRDARALLLFHDAGTSSLQDFGSLMARLEPYVHVVAFDAPAHGESSDRPPTPHFLRAADKHAVAVLDYLEIDRVVVAGSGLGAAAAATLAVNAPDRVGGLALVDPNLLATDEDVDSAAEAIESACGETMANLASHLIKTLPEAAEATVSTEQLRGVDCPILVCGSRRTTALQTLRLHHDLPKSSLAMIAQFDDRDAALSRLLAAFVGSVKT